MTPPTDPDTPPPVSPPTGQAAPVRRKRRWRGCTVCLVLILIAIAGTYLTRSSLPGRVISRLAYRMLDPIIYPHDTHRDKPLPDTVAGVLKVLEPEVTRHYQPAASGLGIDWPPARVRLVGLKQERLLEVWVGNRQTADWKLLDTLPILGASGVAGPKRREGDKQVPEGIYRLTHLNPQSQFHLSIRVDYPNAADIAREKNTDRDELGGDIYIHGYDVSIGCLAIGNEAIERLFTLVALADPDARDIVIAPADFRRRPDTLALASGDREVSGLYKDIAAALAHTPLPGEGAPSAPVGSNIAAGQP